MKNGFFQINQLGIGLLVRKCAEIGQKWEFIALFSEIYMKIGYLLIFELNYTSAPIAQLAERLTFFIWFWLDQTSPERVRVQFPLEEHDFFSLFKLIFLSIFCMHLYHILINWSQKFWVVYVCYRFILEQCAPLQKVKFLGLFLFIFKFSIKTCFNHIFNILFCKSDINNNKHFQLVLFDF